MRCFIHPQTEAIAVCKRCGKAMCDDCSSYSGHSGICPECRLNEFRMEEDLLKKKIIKAIVTATIIGIAGIALAFSDSDTRLALGSTMGLIIAVIIPMDPKRRHILARILIACVLVGLFYGLSEILANPRLWLILIPFGGLVVVANLESFKRRKFLLGEIDKLSLATTKGSGKI